MGNERPRAEGAVSPEPKIDTQINPRKLSRRRFLIHSVLAATGLAAAALVGCRTGQEQEPTPEENIFGFTIPQSIEELEDAFSYINDQFRERYDGIFQTDKFRVVPKYWISTYEDPKEKPDFWLVINNVVIPADYQKGKEELASELQKLFYKPQWDICQFKLEWDIAKAPNAVIINPQGQDVWKQMGIDREEAFKTPECEQ